MVREPDPPQSDPPFNILSGCRESSIVEQPQNNGRCDIRIYMMYDFHKVNNKQGKNLIHQRLTG